MYDDYSLMLRNRLALEGEELVAHRFSNGTVGMVPVSDYRRCKPAIEAAVVKRPTGGVRQTIRNILTALHDYWSMKAPSQQPQLQPDQVVGIPSDALLRICDISPWLRKRLRLASAEDAILGDTSAQSDSYRDSLCFGNGSTLPLDSLCEGQEIRVVQRSWTVGFEEDHERISLKDEGGDEHAHARMSNTRRPHKS